MLLSRGTLLGPLAQAQEVEPTRPEATEVHQPVPPKVVPGRQGSPPSDAIVLFDGRNMDQWISSADSTASQWPLNADGSLTVQDGSVDIQTTRNYGSVQLHLEWRSPAEVRRKYQIRGNCGASLSHAYEYQLLDNNDNVTYVTGQAASVFHPHIPMAPA